MAGLVVAVLLASCTDAAEPTDSTPPEIDSAELMALALTELARDDPPSTEFLIRTSTTPLNLEGAPSSVPPRPLTAEERAAIEGAISQFGAVTWIEDLERWGAELRANDNRKILGVDVPIADLGGALVPVSLWCWGECGAWFTYRLEMIDGVWEIDGIVGPTEIG